VRPSRSPRLVAAAIALLLGGAAYVAAPGAAASARGFTPGGVPTSSTSLNGSVVVGPGGASTGYYTKVAVITQGSTLAFVNLDQLAHTVTSVARKANGAPLFTGNALPGSTVDVTGVSKLPPGTYDFYCQFHPNMTGQLIVEGSGGKPVKPPKLKFPMRLPVPRVLTGSHIRIPVRNAAVRMLPNGPKTQLWTFGGTYPGPTIKRPAGHKTKVTFVNKLSRGVGPITVHFHGDHHASRFDGQPDSHLVRAGHRRTYTYPLTAGGKPEPAAFEFYHDHRMGETSRDIWNGLQGMVVITHKGERKLHLPTGKYDVPLAVADRSFDNLNQLTEPFPTGPQSATEKINGPYAPPGDATVGDHVLVNGRYRPHLAVKAHRYRLRILNASNFQSYDFALSDGRSLTQIGNGDGLLPKPVVRKDIMLGPAQRADVIVNFRGESHKRVLLKSIPRSDNSPGGLGTPSEPLMEFRVGHKTADHSRVPARMPSAKPIKASGSPTAVWTFGLGGNASRGTFWTVNGSPYNPRRVDETVPLGSTQTWLLENLSTTTHFIHIHEEEWHTLAVNGKPPPAYDKGLVDTWRLDPGDSVEVAAKFDDYPGVFMIHCHMLDHEDHGMMAQFAVAKPGKKSSAVPAGYFRGTGPAMPAALAAMPLNKALATVAAVTNHVRVTPAMAAMGMGAMGDAAQMSDMDAPAPGWMHALVRLGWVISIELPLFALVMLWRRRHCLDAIGLRAFAILMLAGVAITHASDWLDKLQEAPYLAVGFGLLIAGSAASALALATWRRARPLELVGGWASGLTIAGYLWSRAIGLPQIPDHVGHWADPWGIASLAVEVPLVLLAVCRYFSAAPAPTTKGIT
jgi:spore coat protein A